MIVYEGMRTILRKTDESKSNNKTKTCKTINAFHCWGQHPFILSQSFGFMSFYLVLLGHFLFLTDYNRNSYRQVNPKFAFSIRMPATMLGCLHSNTNIPASFYKSSLVWYLFTRWSLTWPMERGRPLESLSCL